MTSLKTILVAALAVALGALSAVALAACSDDDITGDSAEEVSVVLREFDISPERVRASEGAIEFVVNNEGNRVHELAVETATGVERTGAIKPGETGRVTVDLARGRHRIYDPRADYRERGMRAVVIVSGRRGTVTERTVERTVIEEDRDRDRDVDVPEVQEPEVQEPEVQPPPPPRPPPPPPPPTVTRVVPAPPPPPAEEPPPAP